MRANLATSGSCLTSSRISSVLTSRAQQGKHVSNRMKIDRCRMMPTLRRFPLPNVWNTPSFFRFVSRLSWHFGPSVKAEGLTWDIRVSHAAAKPVPIDMPRTFVTWGGGANRGGSECVGRLDLISLFTIVSDWAPRAPFTLAQSDAAEYYGFLWSSPLRKPGNGLSPSVLWRDTRLAEQPSKQKHKTISFSYVVVQVPRGKWTSPCNVNSSSSFQITQHTVYPKQ